MTDHAPAPATSGPAKTWMTKENGIRAVILVILVLAVWFIGSYMRNGGSTQNSVVQPQAATQQPATGAVGGQQVNISPAPVAAPVSRAPTCDTGWDWNVTANMCTRTGRPSLQQQTASFEAANCKPGETREIKRTFVENGHEVTRTVTQTCGARP